jgi:hypothetical protein
MPRSSRSAAAWCGSATRTSSTSRPQPSAASKPPPAPNWEPRPPPRCTARRRSRARRRGPAGPGLRDHSPGGGASLEKAAKPPQYIGSHGDSRAVAATQRVAHSRHSFVAYEPYRALYPDLVDNEIAGRAQGTQAIFRGLGTFLALLGGGLLISISDPLPFLAAAAIVAACMAALPPPACATVAARAAAARPTSSRSPSGSSTSSAVSASCRRSSWPTPSGSRPVLTQPWPRDFAGPTARRRRDRGRRRELPLRLARVLGRHPALAAGHAPAPRRGMKRARQ